MSQQKLTASQRAMLFSSATRQNLHMLPMDSVDGGARTLTFDMPKTRLLSNIMVEFDFEVKIKHATRTTLPTDLDIFAPYRLIRRISLDLNNGFAPYMVSGVDCAMLNMIHRHNSKFLTDVSTVFDAGETKDLSNAYGSWSNKGASTDGKTNHIRFCLEMPVTINDREPIGIILLQNDTTNVRLTIDFANGMDMLNFADGFEAEILCCKVSPCVETFSIPGNTDCFPDISVIKLTHAITNTHLGMGEHIIKIDTGYIYRRILLYFTDENGHPIDNEDIVSNLSLVFNQADTNYSVSPSMLRLINTKHYGYTLPKGMYVFDFAYQGIPGLSGTRDYMDTEKLTEFWIKYNTKDTVRYNILTESLTRIKEN